MKQFAFISDIHGNSYALEAVLKDIENRGVEEIYCVGDSVGYNTRPNEVLNKLKEVGILSVLGNHDEMTISYSREELENPKAQITPQLWTARQVTPENLAYIKTMQEQIVVDMEGKKVRITHGSPYSNCDYIFEDDVEKQLEIASELKEDILIFGHTHNLYQKKVLGKLLVNAGSVGRSKDGDNRAGYVILSIDEEVQVEFVRVPYDTNSLVNELLDSQLPNEFAEVIRTGKVET